MKLNPTDYGTRIVIKEFQAILPEGETNVTVPVGERVEAQHNREDDPLLVFRWNGANYKTEAATYRESTEPFKKKS